MLGSLGNYGPSDFFLQHGYSHKCVCGGHWTDSDGGPCHAVCERCEAITDVDDMENGLCPKCQEEVKDEL